MVKLFVVEGIVWFSYIDLFSRILDARHLVGHFRRLLHVLGIGQVPVSPMSTVYGPANTIKPDRLISQLLRNLFRGKNYGGRSITGRTDIQSLDWLTDGL